MTEYRGQDVDVQIPKGVTKIGEGGIVVDTKTVVIPKGVTEIGVGRLMVAEASLGGDASWCDRDRAQAFDRCEHLQSVVIPEGVTIGGAFLCLHQP